MENTNAHRIVMRKPLRKQQLGRLRKRQEDNVKMVLREIGCKDGKLLEVSQDCVS